MKKAFSFLPIALVLFINACTTETKLQEEIQLPEGKWRAVLSLGEEELPFIFELKNNGINYTFEIINGKEKIFVDEIIQTGDSFFVKLPIFDSEIIAKVTDKKITGNWVNNARKIKNVIPFTATHALDKRFYTKERPNYNVTGSWEIGFFNPLEKDDAFKVEKAIGEFRQKDEIVTGTIMTPTGDYRYLEGVVDGDSLYLSSFDGAHAFLFKAKITIDNFIEGDFRSGLHWSEKWIAEKNENYVLPDPDSLTFLKNGFEKIEFSFPNLEGKQVSFGDKKYEDKVVIIQIMGSWCPNCMDETAFLSKMYNRYNVKGLEIIALAYETSPEFEKAKKTLQRLIKRFDAKYDFLIAGTSDKKQAVETLPFLNHLMAFPTTIFIDKNGKVRKIHTGFTGPGTGKHYDHFVDKTTSLIEKLLNE